MPNDDSIALLSERLTGRTTSLAPSEAAFSMAARACAMLRLLSAVTESWHSATLNCDHRKKKLGTRPDQAPDLRQKTSPKESEPEGRHLGERRDRELEGGRGARLLWAEGGVGGGGHGSDATEWEAGGRGDARAARAEL